MVSLRTYKSSRKRALLRFQGTVGVLNFSFDSRRHFMFFKALTSWAVPAPAAACSALGGFGGDGG